MKPRLEYAKIAPGVVRSLAGLDKYLADAGLEGALLDLVKLRASQINGCAYCIDMHSKDARASGETEQRLYALSAWRDAPYYTDRERAALAWTESVTLIAEQHVSDALFELALAAFSEQELVNLTLAVIAINGWNRIAISFRPEVGRYAPPAPRSG